MTAVCVALPSFILPFHCSLPSLSLPLPLVSDYTTVTLITTLLSSMAYIYLTFHILINCLIICVGTMCKIYTISTAICMEL